MGNKKGYVFQKQNFNIYLLENYKMVNVWLYGVICDLLIPKTYTKFLTVKDFHEKLGHPGIQYTIHTTKVHNIYLYNPLTISKPCEYCGIEKSRRIDLEPVRKNYSLSIG